MSDQLFSLMYIGSSGFMCRFVNLCTRISGLGCLIQSLITRNSFEILSASLFISYLPGMFKGEWFLVLFFNFAL